MAIQLWHIQHINDTFANLNSNMEEWQWANITDYDNLLSNMDDTGYITVYAAQFKTNDAGSSKTYLDTLFNDITAFGDIFVSQYIKFSDDSTNYLSFQDNDIQLSTNGVIAFQSTDSLFTFNPNLLPGLDFQISTDDSGSLTGVGIFVDASTGHIGINTDTPSYRLDATVYSTSVARFACTAASANNPDFQFYRPVVLSDSSDLFQLNFVGYDDASADETFAQIKSVMMDDSAGTEYGALIFSTVVYGALTETLNLQNAKVGIGKTPSAKLSLDLATKDLDIIDAGTDSATEAAWVEVDVSGTSGYLRVYAAK